MRFIFLFFFLFFLSCNSLQKKVYICGDRPCIDKKEFNEYFSKNLVIEIKKDKNEKLKVIDLVKLNTDSSSLKNNNKKTNKQDLRLIKKAEKEKLKADKRMLKETRKIEKAEKKIKEKEKKLRKKEKKQIFKASKPSIKKKEISNSQSEIKNEQAKVSVNKKKVINKKFQIDSVEAKNIKSLCTEIENCNIEKVAEILIKKGKDKPFPNITSN
jgi:hypothetical protein